MWAVYTISLLCVLFQSPLLWALPVPKMAEPDPEVPVVIEETHAIVRSVSPADLPVGKETGTTELHAPENIFSDAALASILQLVQKSLLTSFAPPTELTAGFIPVGRIPNSGEVTETVIGPGTKLRVVQRTYSPPAFTSLPSGQKNNKVTQKFMYGTENFSAVQSGFGNHKDEVPPRDVVPEVIDVQTDGTAPKDVLNEIEVLESIRNEIEKLNSVF